ncbi:cytochrome P450 4V2-like [Clavelina lepadiformis]|uniref:cytochrome P450 4V2-like n=1 Tax=Clavelina lepadiformis TaxID=159417 RepID=UPI00404219BC
MSIGVLAAVFLLSTLLVTYWKEIKEFLRFRKMIAKLPSPNIPTYPLIGHTYNFVGDAAYFFHYISSMAKQYIMETKNKLTIIWLGPMPLLMALHPDTAEVILKSSKHMEKSYVYTFLHPWLGTGLLTAGGEKWKQRRRLITPSFHFDILQDFLDVMNEQTQTMISKVDEKFKSGQKVDINKVVTMCALDIICETAMGKTVNAQSNYDSAYVKSLYRLSEIIQLRQKTPILWWDFGFEKLKIGLEHKDLLRVLHDFTKSVITQRMETNKSSKVTKRMAFLDVLLHAVTEDGEKLSLSDIQEEVDTFMFEGHDTTAAAMTWAIYYIGSHPEVQKRIHDELDKVFGDDVDRNPTMDELKRLQYLEQVIKEALRLSPSVPLIARVTTEDCEMDGYLIPKGTQAAIFIYALHHNPEVWEEPERFDPDRFNKENSIGRNPFAHIAFSAGPRNCIGQRFALLEEKVIISKLLRRYVVVSHNKKEDIRMEGDLILRPADPLNISLKLRSDV